MPNIIDSSDNTFQEKLDVILDTRIFKHGLKDKIKNKNWTQDYNEKYAKIL